MTEGLIVLFGGPAGAGKTTLADAWCATRPRAVHIQLDEIRSLIVSGLADPQGGGLTVSEQYAVSVDACCALARSFASRGYDVAIDDVLEPKAFEEHWRPSLDGVSFSMLVVLPSLEDTLRRSRDRAKGVREDITRGQHKACSDGPSHLRLDTSGLSVEQSLALAQERGLLP